MGQPNLLSSYASGYGHDEQERLEARFQAIENQVGMRVTGALANNLLAALARGGVPDLTQSAYKETITGNVISTTKLLTALNSAGGAITGTLAAPSSQDGQLKLITMSDATSASTVSGTNVDGQSGKTAAFSAVTKYLVLMALGTKWVQIAGNVTWS